MSARSERLYALLPAVYRLRDAELGEPLRALMGVMEDQLVSMEENIEALGEEWFIETCSEWVIPYIGDLVGNIPLHEVASTRRADVAKTIYYRRRKGTLPMLEELARDVTGWGAHAAEFMERIGWTQNVNHLRLSPTSDPDGDHPPAVDRVGTANVRNADLMSRLDGAFDDVAHTVDVRRPAQARGWYGVRNVGFFLYRLRSYPREGVPARRAAGPNTHGFHMSTLGAPTRLYTRRRREADPARVSREIHVPAPIRPLAFRGDLEAYRRAYESVPPGERPTRSRYYGPGRSVSVVADGVPVEPLRILCKDLEGWERPPAGRVAIDVTRGRVTFPVGEEPTGVVAEYSYGFSGDIGGGPYDRRAVLASPADADWSVSVARGTPVSTLQQALTLWTDAGRPDGVIQIEDDAVYGGALAVGLPSKGALVIQAADGHTPTLRPQGRIVVSAPAEGGSLTLNGLLIEGGLELQGAPSLRVIHSTLVPGRRLREDGTSFTPAFDSIVVAGADPLPTVRLDSSVCGAIRLPRNARGLTLQDSIVQGLDDGGGVRAAIAGPGAPDAPGPVTTLERVTVLGPVFVRELELASEVIFAHPVSAERKQVGCVRYSYVAPSSHTPRRFRCQPDLSLEGITDPAERARIELRTRPSWTSTHYGTPAFAQLHLACPDAIRQGAEDGSEMGAFSSLLQPQREANLRLRLDEYLPFGLQAGLVYVT